MASKIKKNFGASIIGTLDIGGNGILTVDVDDIGTVILSDFISEFNGKDVKINVSYSQEDT